MSGLVVDGSGNVTGTLELQDGDILAGKHEIELIGDLGTIARGLYINDPSASITDIRQTFVSSTTEAFMPMAQSFKVGEGRDLIAIKVDLNKGSGTEDVVIQVREMDNGVPSHEKILAEGRVLAANIAALGTYTRFNIHPPVALLNDREYCFGLITNNVDYTVAVAELGGTDVISGDIVAKQPNAGVLLTSSNGSSWTPEQNKDLKFQLVAATYADTTTEIDLGVMAGTNISDFMLLARTEISDKDSQISFIVTDPDDAQYTVDKDQKIILSERKTGDFRVTAILKGSTKHSPILMPNVEIVLANIQASGIHYSKKFKCPDSFSAKVIIDARVVASGSYTVRIESATLDNYVLMTASTIEVLADGFIRTTWTASSLTEVASLNLTSLKITASCPTVASRIFMRNLIAFVE